MNMSHPRLSVGESTANTRTTHYSALSSTVVIVSRNLERTNENDGFKMTALECADACRAFRH